MYSVAPRPLIKAATARFFFFGHITTDERGRFNIELPAGSYDLVFRDGGGRHLIGTISVP